MRLRLYLDEDVNPALARLLRTGGYDVTSSNELGANGETDEQQLDRARSDGRAILTFNFRDFERLAAIEAEGGRTHAGIVISYHQYDRNELGILATTVQEFIDTYSAEDLVNASLVLPYHRRS